MDAYILVGCGSAKLDRPAPAAELYTGSLAHAAIRYAKTSGRPWAIVSARYGLLLPDEVVEPYDQQIPPRRDLAGRLRFAQLLYGQLRELRWSGELELHMGQDYAETVAHVCATGTYSVTTPLRGLTQGARLAWYRRQGHPDAERPRMRRKLRDLTDEEYEGLQLARMALEKSICDWLSEHDGDQDPIIKTITNARGRAADSFCTLMTELTTFGVGTPR